MASLAAFAAGRIEALEETYDEHGNALYRLALIIARNRGAAEEAVAGAFSGVWQAPGNVDLREQSLRGALADAVYSRCGEARGLRRSRRRATGLGALATCPANNGVSWRWSCSVSTLAIRPRSG